MVSDNLILAEKEYIVNVLGKQLFDIDERDHRRDGYGELASKYWPEYFSNGKIIKGYNVHHIDFDRSNNVVSNLVVLTVSEHRQLHWMFDPKYENTRKLMSEIAIENRSKQLIEYYKTDKGRETKYKISAANREYYTTEEGIKNKELKRQRMKEYWKNKRAQNV